MGFLKQRGQQFLSSVSLSVTVTPQWDAVDGTPILDSASVSEHSLSVVIPAFNEEVVIADTLLTIISALETLVCDFEVLIVNDGSRDKTGAIAEQMAAIDDRVRVIHHQVNRGYGAAIGSGIAAATKELTLCIDADGQFDIHDLARFLPLIEQYDAVIGYRLHRQGCWPRRAAGWAWNRLLALLFAIPARDMCCAFKLYKSDLLRHYHLETNSVMIHAEILYRLKHAGYTCIEIGVQHYQRHGSKTIPARPIVIWHTFNELFHYAIKWHRETQKAE